MQRTVTIINLPAIRQNALKIKKRLNGAKFFAVVKADAYGHGAEEVSRYIEDIADGFCVAITEEGISLRNAGIQKDILVFTPPLDKYDASRMREYNLLASVNSVETALLAGGLPCHIKVNTGMNRLGCNINELDSLLESVKGEVRGVYSHMYAPENDRASAEQLKLFKKAEKTVKSRFENAVAHLSASGGILRGGKFLLDGVRCGILLYGYAPSGFTSFTEPAMKVYARKVQTTAFTGGGVGYNIADKEYKKLSVYRCGYADGFSRIIPLGEKTLCMDCFLSEDTDILKPVMLSADDYGKRCGTISYEILTKVTQRSERIYER